MFDLGTQELIVIFIVAFLVFGPKKLPELGRTLGKGMRELKTAMRSVKDSFEEAESDITEEMNKAKSDIEKVYEGFEIPDFKKEALKTLNDESKKKDSKADTSTDSDEEKQLEKPETGKDG
ncbi:MAG: twin-arginine translocase TatA/TatE family subunit [Nitrospiraceae bacterium]|nr:MAG: twin-arginine translocase TatA/TatE family subunit [Nitrospiraceae bacterium]